MPGYMEIAKQILVSELKDSQISLDSCPDQQALVGPSFASKPDH